MAKDMLKKTNIVELSGVLDLDDNDNLVVFVEKKDEPPISVNIKELLHENVGTRISCKIASEVEV